MDMKTIRKYTIGLFAVAAAMLCGCTSEMDGPTRQDEYIRITGVEIASGGLTTRAADANGYEGIVKTSWVDGDEVELRIDNIFQGKLVYDQNNKDWKIYDDGDEAVSEILISKSDYEKGFRLEVLFKGNTNLSPPERDMLLVKGIYREGGKEMYNGDAELLPVSGKLNLTLEHYQSYITVRLNNNLHGETIAGVKLVQHDLEGTVEAAVAMKPVADSNVTDNTTEYEIFADQPYIGKFVVTLESGVEIDAVPAYGSDDAKGFAIVSHRHYPFNITLNNGKADVTVATDAGMPGWNDGGGNGDVIRIYTADQLSYIGASNHSTDYPSNGNYVLMNDLDMNTTHEQGGWNGGTWIPICSDFGFSGQFNGNGYTIRNLSITASNSMDDIGLFSYILDGTVYNLHLENVTISYNGNDQVNIGTAAGTNEGRIDNCSVNGVTITATRTSAYDGDIAAGGMVGHNIGTITRCRTNNANITVEGLSATSTTSYSNGYTGGITGYNQWHIAACYTLNPTLSVKMASDATNVRCYAGGVTGYSDEGSTLLGCYTKGVSATAAGTTSNNSRAGALTGYIVSGSNVYNSYAITSQTELELMGGGTVDDVTCVAVGATDYAKLASDYNVISATSITANTDGSLNIIVAVEWKASGIWGTVTDGEAPSINLSYNGN